MQAPQTALSVATGFRLGEQFVVVVEPHRTVAQCPSDTPGASALFSPDTRGQTELGMVGARYSLCFVFEGLQHQQRAKNFFLAKECAAVAMGAQRRREKCAFAEFTVRATSGQQHFV